jgi:hypothetical protein
LKQENILLKNALTGKSNEVMSLENVLIQEREKQFHQHRKLLQLEQENSILATSSHFAKVNSIPSLTINSNFTKKPADHSSIGSIRNNPVVTNTVKRDYQNILGRNDFSTINKNTTDLNEQILDQRIKAISSEF